MATNTTYLDEFIDKMYLVPNDINRHLRLIRNLDKRAETVQQALGTMQGRFLAQLKQYKQSLNSSSNGSKKQQPHTVELPISLRTEYEKIVSKQKQLYGYYKQKYDVSQQLKVIVSEFYQQLDNQFKNKLKQKTEEEKLLFDARRKSLNKLLNPNTLANSNQNNTLNSKIPNNNLANGNTLYNAQNGQFTYDQKQPTYCYCARASFGEMVMCENPYCEREWFHVDCIDEKNLPEKWYCLECQKQKDKTRNTVSRGFFINKQNQNK